MMRAAVILFLMAAMPVNAWALDIVEAINAALMNHESVQGAEASMTAARAEVGQAASEFLPRVDASYRFESLQRDAASSVYPDTDDESSAASVTASLEVFSGLSGVNRVKAASIRANAAGYRVKTAAADVVYEARTAYIDVLRALRELDVARTWHAFTERQRADVEAFLRQGRASRVDVLKVEVEMGRAERRLLAARTAHANALARLSRIVGRVILPGEPVEDLSDETTIESFDETALVRRATGTASEVEVLELTRRALSHDARAAAGSFFPTVEVFASRRYLGDDVSPSGRDELHDTEDIYGVSATWRLYGGARTKRMEQLHAEEMAVAHRLAGARKDLAMQIGNAVRTLELAVNTRDVAQTEVARAEEHLRVMRLMYAQHIATTADVLDAASAYTEAEKEYHEARYDIEAAAALIDRLTETGPNR